MGLWFMRRYLVGSHGEGVCAASIRTGEFVHATDACGDSARATVGLARVGEDRVVAARADGALEAWRVDCESGKTLPARETPVYCGLLWSQKLI